MLNHFFSRINGKLKSYHFLLKYGRFFKFFGNQSKINSPCRFDGIDNISIGENSFIQKNNWLYAIGIEDIPANLTIGNNCVLGYNNHITCVRTVVLGDSILTANNVYISDNLHSFTDISKPIIDQPVVFKKAVIIGSGSWLGENVCIIGASVGKNCVIGANSVVTRDIPDYSVAVGSPAKVIKKYNINTKSWEKV